MHSTTQHTAQIFAGVAQTAPNDPDYEPGMGGALLCWPADFDNPAGEWVQMRVDDYLKQYPYQNGCWTGPWVEQLQHRNKPNAEIIQVDFKARPPENPEEPGMAAAIG